MVVAFDQRSRSGRGLRSRRCASAKICPTTLAAEAMARDVPVAITIDLCRARDYADRRDLKCAKAL